jgi:outer membrane protein, heavy metal efflux system
MLLFSELQGTFVCTSSKRNTADAVFAEAVLALHQVLFGGDPKRRIDLKRKAILITLALSSALTQANAQQTVTLEQALAIARIRGPQIVAARGRTEEARGRLAGASVLLQENPAIETSIGPRFSSNGDTTDYDVTVSRAFELGGRRDARITGARAGLGRETATSRDVGRRLLRDVSVAFVRGLAAKERLRLAEATGKIADELYQSMNRRYEAGDVPVLDVNIARNSAARARAEVRAAQAARIAALGDLRVLLGMTAGEPFEISGDLRDRRQFDPRC